MLSLTYPFMSFNLVVLQLLGILPGLWWYLLCFIDLQIMLAINYLDVIVIIILQNNLARYSSTYLPSQSRRITANLKSSLSAWQVLDLLGLQNKTLTQTGNLTSLLDKWTSDKVDSEIN